MQEISSSSDKEFPIVKNFRKNIFSVNFSNGRNFLQSFHEFVIIFVTRTYWNHRSSIENLAHFQPDQRRKSLPQRRKSKGDREGDRLVVFVDLSA